ncbi:MAG: chorismate synthase, partial [Chlamydiia bacterium]|nr:chorismate synthase [Chlamydiia bacterium]
RTTGAPISLLIENSDVDSDKYSPVKELYKPGHAHFTYLQKYGIYDHRGGGRASARETACRVAAGAIAKKALRTFGVEALAWLSSVGEIAAAKKPLSRLDVYSSNLFCPDEAAAKAMAALIQEVKEAGDSIGGVVEFMLLNLPAGLGDPVYEKLEANLAKAMMGLPASKGFEIGEGFKASTLRGSQHNDGFTAAAGSVRPHTNFAGGTLGGISTGMPVTCRVAFKPTSSIRLPQKTATVSGKEGTFQLPEGSRHDPCVAVRAVPVVEAMAALVALDALLVNRTVRLDENARYPHSASARPH